MAAAEIEGGGAPQLLGHAQLHLAALAVSQIVVVGKFGFHLDNAVLSFHTVAAHPAVGGIGKVIVAAGGVAVAHQLQVSPGLIQGFVIEETHRLSLMLAVVRQRGVGLGDIQRQGAEIAHVFPHPKVKGAIAVRQLSAAVQGPAGRQAMHGRALEKIGRFLLAVAAAVLPGGEGEAGMAFTLQHRHR